MKRGDGGGRDTEREDWRGSSTTGHSVDVWQPPHTRGEDKTRHGNGWTHKGKTRQDMRMGGHTRGRKTWDTQGEREGRRQGVALPKTLTTQKKEKKAKRQ